MDAGSELDRVLDDIWHRLNLEKSPPSPQLFKEAVDAWCKELEWPLEAASLGQRFYPNPEAYFWELASAFDAKRKCLAKLKNWLKWAFDKPMSKKKAKGYLLMALLVAAVGYALYRRRTRQPQGSRSAPSPRRTTGPARWVLVLVINADRHKNVIDALRSGGVKALEGEQLYKATQSLWVGTEEEFRDSKLAEWFREERAVAEESKSEYDVHLVRVDLPADDVGLHRDVNQVDRADAFRRIQSMKDVRVTVSDRLPSDAYGTTGVYKR